jgi:hypothetical protein
LNTPTSSGTGTDPDDAEAPAVAHQNLVTH